MAPPPEASDPAYVSGAATLRSAKHTARYSKARKDDPGPVAPRGALPAEVMETSVISYDRSVHDLAPAVARLLKRAGPAVGSWPDPDRCGDLEDFVVPAQSLRDSKAGSCDEAQAHLADMVAADESRGGLLQSFDAFVCERVLPELKRRLAACGALANEHEPVRFWYQRPPTLRLQPGPSTRFVRAHADADYGHQHGDMAGVRGGGGRLLAVGHRGGSGCDVSRDVAAASRPGKSYELDEDVNRLQGRRGGVLRPGMVHEGDQGGSQQEAGDVVNRK